MTKHLKPTELGYVSRNDQCVIRDETIQRDDRRLKIYVLRCLNPDCRNEYGATGSEVHQRKCPNCQGGRPGFPVKKSRSPAVVLARIAALPDEGSMEPISVADHDRIIYGDHFLRHPNK
jgi:hypothetical protein